jgi:hypothetical protein
MRSAPTSVPLSAESGPVGSGVDIFKNRSRNFYIYNALGLVVSLGLLWQIFNPGDPGRYFSLGSMPGPDRSNLMERLASEVRQAPGDFLSDDAYLVLGQGRAMPYDNLYHMRLESQEQKWDDQLFLQDLRDRRFGLVLLEHNARRFTDEAWQVLNANYQLIFPDGIDMWRPRPRPLTPQYSLGTCQLTSSSDTLGLSGYSLGLATKPLHAGDGLTLTTYWNVFKPVANNYTLFVHLIDSSGATLAQRDAQPDQLDLVSNQAKVAPTSSWQPGLALTIDQSLPLPAQLKPGNYTLVVGAYRAGANGPENMQPQCASVSGSVIQLGQIKIQ